jgi:hypothetical protein
VRAIEAVLWFAVRRSVGLSLILALLVCSSMARASSTVVLDPFSSCGPALNHASAQDCLAPTVAEYGGWVAWSRSDITTGEFALVLRSPAGAILVAPVPERVSPFDVELGPSGGGVVAVYSRCTNTLTQQGCSIYELALGKPSATEKALRIPEGGSLHEPAIWRNRMVLLRRSPSGGSEDPGFPGRRPDSLFAWKIGSGRLLALTLPGSRGVRFRWPRGLTGVISGLTFDGKQVAYATSTAKGVFTLWHQRLSQGPGLVDQTTSGGASVCRPAFLSPTFSGGWLYSYFHACGSNGNADADRWTRYSLTGHRAQRARFTFIHYGDEQIFSVVPIAANGAIWDNGEVHQLTGVTWRSIPRPGPVGFPPLP